MKKITLLTVLLLASVGILFAQSPDAFNYQAVVRNNSGDIVANQAVSVKLSVLQGSASGTVEYSEKHSATSNQFGLVNLKIGAGTQLSGTFSTISWGSSAHYIKVEMDANGGSSYSNYSTAQLLSVPYALHANTVENDQVDDADANPANEIQTISLSGTQLTLSEGGGTVALPSGGSSLWTESGSDVYRSAGKVGIGTSTPKTDLHVDGIEGLLVQGTRNSGTTLNLGAGTRMHFYPTKGAFRAGTISGEQWDDANIGNYSTAMGRMVSTNSKTGSFIIGDASSNVTANSTTNNQMTMRFDAGYRFFINSTELGGVVFDSDGNVGIGTAYPACKLHIRQAGNGSNSGLRLQNTIGKYWNIQANDNSGESDLVLRYNSSSTRAWIKNTDASYNKSSDRRLKQNINSIENALDKVMLLKPVTYELKANPNPKHQSYGFIAQEVEEIYPGFVSENDGMKGLAYSNFGVVAVKAIQEQQEQIKRLKAENEMLKAEVKTMNKEMNSRLDQLESVFKTSASKN